MADDVGALVARVVADTEQFRTEMTRVSRQLETNTARMNRALATVNRNVGSMSSMFRTAARVAGALGVALSLRGMASFANQTLSAAEHLKNLSDRLNISVESLSELQYVAKLTDVDFDTLAKSMQIMVRTLGEAELGSSSARKAFKDLGVDFRVISGLSVDKQLATVAEALSLVENESTRTSLAMKVFGRSGAEILQVARDGAAGINALTKEARELGLVLSTEAADQASAAKDEVDKLTAAVSALARSFTLEAAPALTSFVNALRQEFFPTDAEKAVEAIEAQKNKVAETRAELDRYKAALATHPNTVEPHQLEQLELLRRAAVDARVALMELEFAQPIAGTQTEKPQGLAGLIGSADPNAGVSMAGINRLPEVNSANEMILAGERELTEQIRAEALQRQRSMIDAWNASRDAAVQGAQEEIAARQMVSGAATGLLHALGAKHRGAAIAALAIEKAKAIQQILIHTKVAQMHALATLGPIAGPVAAAKIGVMGKISAALVAATGLIEASQLSSGGTQATLGTSANPINTRSSPSSTAAQEVAAHRQKVVELHVHGNVYGTGGVRQLAEDLRDQIDGADVVIFGRHSVQAQILSRT